MARNPGLHRHLRDVMAAHRDRTRFLVVDTPTILADLDTPEDYAAEAGSQKLEAELPAKRTLELNED